MEIEMNDVKTDETKQDESEEDHQPRERAVPCREFCGRKTWRWNAVCDVCAGKH
jgi:hypothetical protein